MSVDQNRQSGEHYSETVADMAQRRRRVDEILGDPTIFPVIFLGWQRRWLEQSGILLPISSIVGLGDRLDALAATVTALETRNSTLEARLAVLEGK